jgi:hypothetical protein
MYHSTAGGLMLLAAAILMHGAHDAQGADQGRVLRHMVLYKFKDGLPQAQIDEVVAAFSALPQKIDTILDFERGTNTSSEGKSQGLTHAFVVTFRDQQGLDTYLKHPAHLDYVKVVQDKREKVVVFDYWTGE